MKLIKGGYIGGYIGDYIGDYIGEYMGEYCMGYEAGCRSLDYGSSDEARSSFLWRTWRWPTGTPLNYLRVWVAVKELKPSYYSTGTL